MMNPEEMKQMRDVMVCAEAYVISLVQLALAPKNDDNFKQLEVAREQFVGKIAEHRD